MPMDGQYPDELAAFRQRQGKGARYDSTSAPHNELLLARRGTAFFARKLMELSDQNIYLPSRLMTISRARLIVEVSLSARRQALMLEAVCKRSLEETQTDLETHSTDLNLAETLPPHAIRHLFRHSEVHLNVCWRDLSDRQWDIPIEKTADGLLTPRDLPRLRAIEIWQAALNLETGASRYHMPPELTPND